MCNLQQILNRSRHLGHVDRQFKTDYDLSLPVNEKLREVPLDIGTLRIVGALLREHRVELVRLVEAHNSLLALQPGIERCLMLAVYLDFAVLRELRAAVELAELCCRSRATVRRTGCTRSREWRTQSRHSFIDALDISILRRNKQ